MNKCAQLWRMMRSLLLTLPLLALAAPAFADDIVAGRPGNTESPVAVPVGHWQVESELGSFSRGGGQESWSALSTDIRYGVAPGWDAEAIISPINRGGGETGFGDTTLRVRHMLTDPSSEGPAVALIGFVTLPTATDHQGDGGVEGGLIGTGTFSLNDSNGVTWTLGAASVSNNGDNQSDVFGGVNLSHQFTPKFAAYIEPFADRTNHQTATTIDIGATYLSDAHTQWDCGADLGVSDAADDVHLFVGWSHLF